MSSFYPSSSIQQAAVLPPYPQALASTASALASSAKVASALSPAALNTSGLFENQPLTSEALNKVFKQRSNPKKQHSLPWDWIGIASVTGFGLLNPALVVPITYRVAKDFVVNFCGQDLVGMGVPRIEQSLLSDAEIYEPEQDPEAQKLKGAARQLYIFSQQLKRANWVNLYEEMMREVASGPGLLAWGTLGALAFKASSRFTGLPEGRRCFELPLQQVKAMETSFQAYLQHEAPALSGTAEETKALLKGFYTHLFHPEKDVETGVSLLEKPLTLKLDLRQAASHPDYTLSAKELRHLVKANVDGLGDDLQAFAQKPSFLKRLPKQALVQKQSTLKQLVNHWAEAMADNVLLDASGAKRNPFNPKNVALNAKISYYSQAIEQAVVQLNHEQPQSHRFAYNSWPVKLAGQVAEFAVGDQRLAVGDRDGLLGQADKFGDLLASALRRTQKAEKAGQPLSLAKASKQVFNHIAKLGVVKTVGFAGITFWWMWYLAHAIQKGRSYPARRFNPDSTSNRALLAQPPLSNKAETALGNATTSAPFGTRFAASPFKLAQGKPFFSRSLPHVLPQPLLVQPQLKPSAGGSL